MKSIESLYDEYLSSGTCDAEAFLDLKGERSFFESLHGQWLKLVSPAQDQGSFLCLELRILRPSPFSELGFFLNSKGRIRRIEDPLEFLETCHVSEQVDKKKMKPTYGAMKCPRKC